jgi:hypothetical protein
LASSINDPFWMFGLPAAEIRDDFVQTVVVLRDVLVADSPDFRDDLHCRSPRLKQQAPGVRQDFPAAFRLPQGGTVRQGQGNALVVTHKSGAGDRRGPFTALSAEGGIRPGVYAG